MYFYRLIKFKAMDKSCERSPVPVPKPRRHNIDANLNNKIAYENVSIDLINKNINIKDENINIKDENIQNNAKNKLQTDKLFLMPNTSTTSNNNNNNNNADTSATQILTNLNDLANAPAKNQKNTAIHLDEVNKLSNIYNDDENVNAKPVPAPRRSNSKQFNCTPSTGAINKQPTTIDINDFIESPKAKKKQSKNSGSYSFMDDECDGDESPKKYKLKKRLSNSSLSSSHSGSSATEGSLKFHSASPG